MTIAGHLAELRKRLLICAVAFLGFAVLSFLFIQPFVNVLLRLSTQFQFVYLSPSELMTSYLRLALVLGLVFASPVILWQVWAFISPGLTQTERRSVLTAIGAGFAFFLIGTVFCYFVVLPMTLDFLYNFNTSTDITANISFENYMTFVLGMLVVFGVVFEMPVLSYLLARLGVLKSSLLKKGRKAAIVLVFIVAAIITPPDVVSQVITALPMLLLYELSIYVCAIAQKLRGDEEEEEPDESDEESTEPGQG